MQAVVQDIPVHYEARGEGVPILMVHGWSADHRYMVADLEPVFEGRRGWRRIYPDLPGHGETPAPDTLTTQDQMLSVVSAIVDEVVGNEPFAVVGSSWGGLLTLGLVRTMPERISAVALLEPDVPAPDGSRDLPGPVTIHEDRSIFGDLAADEDWIPEALPVHDARMLAEIRAHDMPAYRAADWDLLARLERNYAFTAPTAAGPGRFDGPSLIVAGRQDATVGYRAQFDLLDQFPRATYAVLDLVGHHLGRIEQPGLFRALVSEWLDRIEQEGAWRAGDGPDPA